MRDLYSNDVATAAYLAGLEDSGWPYNNDRPTRQEYDRDTERIRTVSRPPDETRTEDHR